MNWLDQASNVTVAQWGVVLGASLAAAILDIRSRRIPNALTAPLAVAGLLYALSCAGLGGLGRAVAGGILVAVPYVLLFVFAGGGAGDAKMMGALGTWLGVPAGLAVLVAVAATGAVLGLLNLAANRQLASGLRRIGAAFYVLLIALCAGRKGWALVKPEPDEDAPVADQRLTMPYGPAIFIGVCIGAYVVHSWNG
ncbi:MAG: A24 family peptidase [Planctomycetes bacterium]|nr:A24 family peptidase [Planctomycetota bacterium]